MYRFPVLKQEICDELLEEIELFLQWQAEQLRRKVPGSELLNTKLCVLDHLNLGGLDRKNSPRLPVLL